MVVHIDKASLVEQGHAVASWRTVCSSDDGTVLIEGQDYFSLHPDPYTLNQKARPHKLNPKP